MNDILLNLTYELKDALENSNEVKRLKEAEKNMESNEEVMALSYRFSSAQTSYNDILKIYKEDTKEAKEYQHKLYLAKKELDEHPLVKEYLSAFSEVRKIYERINHEILGDFQHNCEHKVD
ncbi:MAG: YlbF family regulator [Bacilli bacterium]